jgi:hypothetical protein
LDFAFQRHDDEEEEEEEEEEGEYRSRRPKRCPPLR